MIGSMRKYSLSISLALLATVASVSPAFAVLQGDCNDDGETAINELVRCSNIYLETQALNLCSPCDRLGDGVVAIEDVVGASNCYLDPQGANCRMSTPQPGQMTATPTPTRTNTLIATATNTPVTPTATNTQVVIPTATMVPPTATFTSTPVTPTATVPPSPTPTEPGGDFLAKFDLQLLPGQGLCAGRCVGGPVEGRMCTQNFECFTGGECLPALAGGTRKCVGGPNNGMACTSPAFCGLPTSSGCRQNPLTGSCAVVQLSVLSLPLNLIGDVSIEFSQPDENGISMVKIPKESVKLVPTTTSFGTACIAAGSDGIGFLDCNGGNPDINVTLEVDHNTTPGSPNNYGQKCIGGTNDGMACTSHANCPGTNALCGGLPDDATCTRAVTQPSGAIARACPEAKRLCMGGNNSGNPCTADANCPGSTCSMATCRAGTSEGSPCTADAGCPGSGTCGTYLCRGGSNALSSCEGDEDCPDGRCIPCNATSPHVGTCNSPTVVTLSGTYAPGDMQIVMPLAIVLTQGDQFGPDAIACTADDTTPPPNLVPVILTTGVQISRIFDFGNTNKNLLAPEVMCGATPCASKLTGKPFSCAALEAGTFNGTFVGTFPALEVQGDLSTAFQFVAGIRPTPVP